MASNEKISLALLTAGHLVNDLYGGLLPALYPIFQVLYGSSYAQIGLYTAAYLLGSAFFQPFFGHMYDRYRLRLMLPLSLVLGGVGIGLLGFAQSFEISLLLVIIAGFGAAIFHPVASALSTSKPKSASLMFSIFMVGGRIGAAIGPLVGLALYNSLGLGGLALLLIPPLLLSHSLYSISHAGMIETRGSGKPSISNVEDDHRSGILLSVISIQASLVTFLGVGISILSNGVTQFISTFSVFLGFGKEFGALLLTANFIGAMIGVPILVRLSDKIGRRLASILLAVSASILTVLLCFPNCYLMIVMMIGLGAFATSIHTILILILHELMPERKGLATSLIYGIAFGIGGLTAPLIGHLIDVGGFISTFQILALIGIISATPLIFMRLRPSG
jgi:FSR family fosmidomycin resistance protein-like MFS transporter